MKLNSKKSHDNKGRKFEDKVKKTIGSGNLWFDKGDLKVENKCIECKFTDNKGFRITLGLLEKLWSQALNANKEPNLIVGVKRNDTEIFIIEGTLRLEKK